MHPCQYKCHASSERQPSTCLACQAPRLPHPLWPPNITGEEKTHGPTGTRTQYLLHTLQATEPHGRPATISPFLNRFVPESARNHAGTDKTVPLLLAAWAWTHDIRVISIWWPVCVWQPWHLTGEASAGLFLIQMSRYRKEECNSLDIILIYTSTALW